MNVEAAIRYPRPVKLTADAFLLLPMWSPVGEAYDERRGVSLGTRLKATTVMELAVETPRS